MAIKIYAYTKFLSLYFAGHFLVLFERRIGVVAGLADDVVGVAAAASASVGADELCVGVGVVVGVGMVVGVGVVVDPPADDMTGLRCLLVFCRVLPLGSRIK